MSEFLAHQVITPISSALCAQLHSCGDVKLLKQSANGLKIKNLACYPKTAFWHPYTYRKPSQQVNVARSSNELVGSSAGGEYYARSKNGKALSPMLVPNEPIRTLLLDNYDSYTYNLYQLLSVINGVAPVVLRNDEITWDDLSRLLYEDRAFHNVVISPGPGSPTCASDVGICMQLLRECHDIPILGVCLGHQALGYVHGAQILHAPEPVHGRLSEIEHSGHPLFASIPSGINAGFKVVRYHSLMVDGTTLPEDLVPTAWTIVESGLTGLEDLQDGLDIPNTAFLSEGQLLWQGRGSGYCSNGYPKVLSNGLLGFDNVDEVTHKKRATKVLMGVSHRSWPHHGVQFHPESVATTYGKQILVNFRDITLKFWEEKWLQIITSGKNLEHFTPLDAGLHAATWKANAHAADRPLSPLLEIPSLKVEAKLAMQLNGVQSRSAEEDKGGGAKEGKETSHLRLHWRKLPGLALRAGGSRTLFCKLFADEAVEDTFWLDSSTREQGRARFSFMGGRGGSLWQRITYRISPDSMADTRGGVLRFQNAAGQVKESDAQEGFLDFLNRELELRQCRPEDYASLPFDFCGGFIGYLGYELKVECGAESNQHKSPMPDAAMFLADRVIVVDHKNDDIYVLALFEDAKIAPLPANSKNCSEDSFSINRGNFSSCQAVLTASGADKKMERSNKLTGLMEASYAQSDGFVNGEAARVAGGEGGQCGRRVAEAWVEGIVRKVNHLAQQDVHKARQRMHHVSLVSSVHTTEENIYPPFVAEKSRAGYIKDVKRCQEFITDGESYEVCLTTQLRRKVTSVDCFGLYLTLRDTNPAPYSSWLHFGKDGPCICSSSPERFLQLDRKGMLEAKPIKGTVARGNTPVEDERLKYELQHSEKDQAENLMIVDLLRNDLGRVCEPGSVHVPSLMAVESYSTVHTMVSTVRGKKSQDVTPVDCVRAAFPGGSMTGAPKLRTMEIIDSLESSPRGVYSGTIGYFSFNSSFDLNIVIRTLVIYEGEASLGAGGAVIALSDPAAEYEEMVLKTKAPIRAVSKYENHVNLSKTSAEQRGPVLPLGL